MRRRASEVAGGTWLVGAWRITHDLMSCRIRVSVVIAAEAISVTMRAHSGELSATLACSQPLFVPSGTVTKPSTAKNNSPPEAARRASRMTTAARYTTWGTRAKLASGDICSAAVAPHASPRADELHRAFAMNKDGPRSNTVAKPEMTCSCDRSAITQSACRLASVLRAAEVERRGSSLGLRGSC